MLALQKSVKLALSKGVVICT